MIEEYYQNGIELIPLKPNSKQPLGKWDKPLSYDDYPKNNVNCGIIAKDNGLVILDIDTHADDPNEGFKSIRNLEKHFNMTLPDTFVVETPSGGQHWYYTLPENMENEIFHKQLKAFPSVDFQTGKAYVVGAGSLIDGEEYHVIKGSLSNIATAPQWLLNTYRKQIHQAKPRTSLTHTGAILSEILEGTTEGARNVWLTSITGKLFRQGMRTDIVKFYVYLANSQGCHPPLERGEVDTIFNSIKRSEKRKLENYIKGETKNV